MRTDPTKRFSSRAGNYARYRPGYPEALYEYLIAEAGLQSTDKIADLGSGTGLLSALFLKNGHVVFGIEPNPEMRAHAERLLAQEPRFYSVEGRAEAIPLEEKTIDFVAAAQAFHWFDPQNAKLEMRRVLVPGKQVALVWNRRDHTNDFQVGYEALLDEYGTDYRQVDQQRSVTDANIAAFFSPHQVKKEIFPNRQTLDETGLKGRLLSSSYIPMEDQPQFGAMMADLANLFSRFQDGGRVHFDYKTTVYHGPIHV
ncbi:MAG: class I SAM-dependent methyltransferase [Anaerolineales bacterium]